MQVLQSCTSLCRAELEPQSAHRSSVGVMKMVSSSKETFTLEFSVKFRRFRKLIGNTTRPNLSIFLSIPFIKAPFSQKLPL